jgi:hypothetical protein
LFIVQCFTIGFSTAEEALFEDEVVGKEAAAEDLRNKSSRRRQESWTSEDTKLRENAVVLISTSRRASSAFRGRRDVPVTDIVNGVVIFGGTKGRMMKDVFEKMERVLVEVDENVFIMT